MLLKRITRLTQKGDTIVEVLISIGVISLILAGAFVVTNRSLQGTRSAQERLNATKLVESQVEQIKSIASSTHASDIFAGAPPTFCILDGSVFSASENECKVGTDGAPTGSEPVFHLSIQRAGNTFTVGGEWTKPGGEGQNRVEMVYKVYE